MDVSDNSAGSGRGGGRSEGFDTVTQDHDDVGFKAVESASHGGYGPAQALGLIEGAVFIALQADAGVDAPAVFLDLADGAAETRQEVHAGDEELKLELRVLVDGLHDGDKKAIFGPRAGNYADATFL